MKCCEQKPFVKHIYRHLNVNILLGLPLFLEDHLKFEGDLYDVFVLVKFGAMNLRKLNSTVTLLVNFETPLLKSLIIFNILLLLALFYDSSTKQKKAVVKCTKNSYTSIFIVSKNV